jgi:serine O-acetyltransferase
MQPADPRAGSAVALPDNPTFPTPPKESSPANQLGELAELLREDLATYDGKWGDPGFLAVLVHRIGKHAQVQKGAQRAVLAGAHRVASNAIDWVWGIRLPLHVELGRRVRIWHHGCVVLNARLIGDDVHLRHNTTLGPLRGSASADDARLLPVIDDGADVGSGACILGPVRVGKGAIVGANTVVLKDVPDRATVLGVPGRVIPS